MGIDRVRQPPKGRRLAVPVPPAPGADASAAENLAASGRPFFPHGLLVQDPSGALSDPYDPLITPSPLNGQDLPSILPNGDFEQSTGGWTGDGNTTLAVTAAAAFTGAKSLGLTAVGAAPLVAYTPTGTDGIPVLPSWVYRVKARIRTAATVRTIKLTVTFYDTHGNVLGAPVAVTADELSTAWTTMDTGPMQAPHGAMKVSLKYETTANAAAAEVHYLDGVEIIPVSGFSGETMVVGNGNIKSGNYKPTVSGWMIDGAGNAEFNNMLLRGLLRAIGGPTILPNGHFDADVAGWAAAAGAISKETVGANILEGAGALKHVTAVSGAETEVHTPESGAGLLTIDPAFTYRLIGNVQPGAVGDACRIAIRWYTASGSFLSETASLPITGITAYRLIQLAAKAPSSNLGESVYAPAADVVALFVAGTPVDSAGNRYQNIDEGTVDSADFIYSTVANVNGGYLARSSITVGALSGKSIRSLKVRCWFARGFCEASFLPVLRIGSTDYYGDTHFIDTLYPDTEQIDFEWVVNPATGAPWTASEIEAFRVGGTNAFGGFLLSDDAPANVAGLVKMELRPQWASGSAAAKASVRLYTDPLSAGGTTTRWDSFFLYPVSRADIGQLDLDFLTIGGVDPTPVSGPTVSTSQTTASTTYVDLATVGPSVTVQTQTSVMVIMSAGLSNDNALGTSFAAVNVSGATTIAAADANSIHAIASAAQPSACRMFKLSGLNPGSNTFKLMYRVGAGTGTFKDRDIVIIPLPY